MSYAQGSKGGLTLPVIDVNDFHAHLAFGSPPPVSDIKPVGRIEKILSSPLKDLYLYQGGIEACVYAGTAMQNQYNFIFNGGVAVRQSWRDGYIFTTHGENRGTDVKEAHELWRTRGVCDDKFEPNFPFGGIDQMLTPVPETDEIKASRLDFRITNHFYVGDTSRESIFHNLQRTIVGIGIGGNNDDFTSGYFNRVTYTGTDWYHYCLIVDVVGDSNKDVLRAYGFPDNQLFNGDWITIQAWNPERLDIRILNSNYPLLFGKTIESLPAGVAKQDVRMALQLIKSSASNKVYLVDPSNIKHWIVDEATFNEYFKDFSQVITVEPQRIDPLQEGEPINANGPKLSDALANLIKQFSIKIGQALGGKK